MVIQSVQYHINTKHCFETGISCFGLVFVVAGVFFVFLLYISPPANQVLESPNGSFAKKMFI